MGIWHENVNLKRRYEDTVESNAYSRLHSPAKINALTAENAKLKTKLSGKMSSGFTASEKPKVLASGMYTNSSKNPQDSMDPHRNTTSAKLKQKAYCSCDSVYKKTKPATEFSQTYAKSHHSGTSYLALVKSVNAEVKQQITIEGENRYTTVLDRSVGRTGADSITERLN
ncbi:hypothetical protein Tco_0163920 [Tanacetum coccineum]